MRGEKVFDAEENPQGTEADPGSIPGRSTTTR